MEGRLYRILLFKLDNEDLIYLQALLQFVIYSQYKI